MKKPKPNPVSGADEWWWFRYSDRSNWQAVCVSRVGTTQVNVSVTGVDRPLNIESLQGEWSGPIKPPKQ